MPSNLLNPLNAYDRARREIALALWDVGVVLTSDSIHPLIAARKSLQGIERGFKFKQHEKNPGIPLSPLYLNLRTPDNPRPGPLTPHIVDLAARCMQYLQLGKNLLFDAVVGVPRAGDPFARVLASLAGKSCFSLEKYEYGGKCCIASLKGEVPASVGMALAVDDVIAKGDSKRETFELLQSENIAITDVMVLADYEMGGREELGGWGCKLHSIFTGSELFGFYVKTKRMPSRLFDDFRIFRDQAVRV